MRLPLPLKVLLSYLAVVAVGAVPTFFYLRQELSEQLLKESAIRLAERGLMIHAVQFMLIVAVPVYILLFFFAYKYRASNKKAAYTPEWEHGKLEELGPLRSAIGSPEEKSFSTSGPKMAFSC